MFLMLCFCSPNTEDVGESGRSVEGWRAIQRTRRMVVAVRPGSHQISISDVVKTTAHVRCVGIIPSTVLDRVAEPTARVVGLGTCLFLGCFLSRDRWSLVFSSSTRKCDHVHAVTLCNCGGEPRPRTRELSFPSLSRCCLSFGFPASPPLPADRTFESFRSHVSPGSACVYCTDRIFSTRPL